MASKGKGRDSHHQALLYATGKLKTIKRSGWLKKIGIDEECESVADHSFRVALLGACLAEEYGLNSGKVARMCLVHDLAEAYTGDVMPEEKKSENEHRSNEDMIMLTILNSLPDSPRKRFQSDWKELVARVTPEAKLVWQVDKLEMGLQRMEYLKMGYDPQKLRQFDPSNLLSPKLQELLHSYKC
jgi:putative hydrolase of HD superfamily